MRKTWKIGHKYYKIEIISRERMAELDLDGYCDHSQEVIGIAEGMSHAETLETVIHELLHAVWTNQDIGFGKWEEKAITRLGKGIAALLIDNDLIEYEDTPIPDFTPETGAVD